MPNDAVDTFLEMLTTIPTVGPWIKMLITLKDAVGGDPEKALKAIRNVELENRDARDERMFGDDPE